VVVKDGLVGKAAVQQQHFDQDAGSAGVTVGFAGRSPEPVMVGGEDLGRPGLGQCCRPGQSAGLAEQDLQIVIQVKDFGAFAGSSQLAVALVLAGCDSP